MHTLHTVKLVLSILELFFDRKKKTSGFDDHTSYCASFGFNQFINKKYTINSIKNTEMALGGLLGRLRQFDAYPKTLEDFRVKTFGGAAGEHRLDIL